LQARLNGIENIDSIIDGLNKIVREKMEISVEKSD